MSYNHGFRLPAIIMIAALVPFGNLACCLSGAAITTPIASARVAAAGIPVPNQQVAQPTAQPAKVAAVARYTLPPTPLSAVEPQIKNDRKMMLGGIGSDIWHGPSDAPNQFWMITDRGPNRQVTVKGKDRRTFPVPDFTPAILQVQADGDALKMLKFIPIVGEGGAAVTGLANLKKHDDKPYAFDAKTELARNPSGLDPEGLVRTSQGDFWIVEEYAPSLVHIAPDGTVIKRYVPQGLNYEGTGYPVVDNLPAIYASRKDNRGFEGLALSPDEKTLYIALQGPLSNPNKRTGEASRNTRILAFDIPGDKVTAEYVYRFEPFNSSALNARDQSDIKLSGLDMIDAKTLLVLERTDTMAQFYAVDLGNATNIAGSAWDDPATSPSLEATGDLAAAGVTPLAKRLAVDLAQAHGIPGKIEGVANLDAKSLAIANDNDFNIGDFDSNGNNLGTGDPNLLLIISLDKPLK
jgi:hypothetical protein